MRIIRQLVRPAADLAIGAAFSTPGIDALGAACVGYFARATNGQLLQSANFETSPEDLGAGTTWYSVGSHGGWGAPVGSLVNALNAGGYTTQIFPTTANRPSAWRGLRLTGLGNAVAIITGLEIWAIVIFYPGLSIIEDAKTASLLT